MRNKLLLITVITNNQGNQNDVNLMKIIILVKSLSLYFFYPLTIFMKVVLGIFADVNHFFRGFIDTCTRKGKKFSISQKIKNRNRFLLSNN